jgi:hypothetical protein
VSGSVLLDRAHQHEKAISDITAAIELLKSKSITCHGLESDVRSRRRGHGGEGTGGEEESDEDEEITND